MMTDYMLGGEQFDDYGDQEVAALWDGQLPMDRVLQTLQEEITKRADWQARAEAAEAEIDGMLEQESFLEAQLAHMQQDLDALREREADLLRTLHVEQDAHDRLREELAALQWRPVTEEPTPWEIVEVVGLGYRRGVEGDDEWIGVEYPEAWRPRPTPPQDDDR